MDEVMLDGQSYKRKLYKLYLPSPCNSFLFFGWQGVSWDPLLLLDVPLAQWSTFFHVHIGKKLSETIYTAM